MEKLGIWAIVLAIAFLAGSIFTGTTAFADDDDDNDRDNDDRDHDDRKKDKTLASECAKKLRKKNLNLDGLFCQAIIAIQDMLAMVKAAVADNEERITDLQSQIDEISVEPEVITRTASDDFNKDSLVKTLEVTCEDDEVFLSNSKVVTYSPVPAVIPVSNSDSGPIECDSCAGDTGILSNVIGWNFRTFDTTNGFPEDPPTLVTVSIACVKP